MASSFYSQIPGIIHVISRLQPASVLDIGKGFGKYGFLIHEYAGIPNTRRVNPALTLKEQSNVKIDALEVDEDLLMPHIPHIYNNVIIGDIQTMYHTIDTKYDLVLMIDIIEHIGKDRGIEILKYFLAKGSVILVATPLDYFEQHLYGSEFENHVSHWTKKDFKKLGRLDYQRFEAGGVYLLSSQPVDIIGFGASPLKRLKRLYRFFRNEWM